MSEIKPEDSLIEYPCQFPVKAMGKHCDEFEITVLDIFRRHVPNLSEDCIKTRPSKGNKYLAITVTFEATSREQLDKIYQELSACELVSMAL
jgi:putative lipoic acid-binding regulatory protein